MIDCLVEDYIRQSNGELIITPSETLWKNALIKFDQRLIWDSKIQSMIHRYLYCLKFNVTPYSTTYDDQPAFWADFCRIMGAELDKYAAMDR